MVSTASSQLAPELMALVRTRDVTWAAYSGPDRSWDLELNAAYSHPPHDPRPWCSECREVYDDLWSIAQHVIPKGARECACAIVPFDGKLSFSPRRGRRKEITLTIRILKGEIAAGRELENPCLIEMERRLAELGARRE